MAYGFLWLNLSYGFYLFNHDNVQKACQPHGFPKYEHYNMPFSSYFWNWLIITKCIELMTMKQNDCCTYVTCDM